MQCSDREKIDSIGTNCDYRINIKTFGSTLNKEGRFFSVSKTVSRNIRTEFADSERSCLGKAFLPGRRRQAPPRLTQIKLLSSSRQKQLREKEAAKYGRVYSVTISVHTYLEKLKAKGRPMTKAMTVEQISHWLLQTFEGVVEKKSYGETAFFYNPKLALPNGIYFLTIKESDGPNDRSSQLDRPGIFRVSWQISKKTFEEKFGERPKRPAKGEAIATHFKLDQLNVHLPHAVYGWMNWTMILAPTHESLDRLKPSIQEAYQAAQRKFEKKVL